MCRHGSRRRLQRGRVVIAAGTEWACTGADCRSDCDANTDTDANTDGDAYPDADANAYANTDTHADADA